MEIRFFVGRIKYASGYENFCIRGLQKDAKPGFGALECIAGTNAKSLGENFRESITYEPPVYFNQNTGTSYVGMSQTDIEDFERAMMETLEML